MSGERPVEIPEWAWDKACEAMNRAGWHMRSVRIECAKAILSAVEEEREACALEALRWEDAIDAAEHIRRRNRSRKEA